MKSKILKILFSFCFLLQFHLFEKKLFAQQKDSLIQLKPLHPVLIKTPARQEEVSPTVYFDSIDNSDFCKNKVKELAYLRTKLFAKIDSVYGVIKILRENNPGRIYYIEEREVETFNFEGCFARNIRARYSHGLNTDVIDVELRIKEEGRFHNNSDGSSGWTIYRDEIQRAPK